MLISIWESERWTARTDPYGHRNDGGELKQLYAEVCRHTSHVPGELRRQSMHVGDGCSGSMEKGKGLLQMAGLSVRRMQLARPSISDRNRKNDSFGM